MADLPAKRRGAGVNPANRFDRELRVDDFEHAVAPPPTLPVIDTEYLDDDTQSVVTANDSPDIKFGYSLNPYRGCEHGCPYCYARPFHEYLGFNAGQDFETKILVKHRAPALLRTFLRRPGWRPQTIVMSGVTDPYQPAEREFRLARQCLEVMLEARQPVGIVTKGTVIVRDLDLLKELAARRLVRVYVAVTSLQPDLQHELEPRAARPATRLAAIARLAEAGVPVGAMVAPVIPGLTDHELPNILAECARAGARSAQYTVLRLPGAVQPIFGDWLARVAPLAQARVENAVRSFRDGALNDATFGQRMKGVGAAAERLAQMFQLFAARHGLDQPLPELDATRFRAPAPPGGALQGTLFDDLPA